MAPRDGNPDVTRVYRNSITGTTWIERGAGTPLVVVSDHGDRVEYRWAPPDVSTLVHDDALDAVEREQLDAQRERLRTALVDQVAGADIAATAKATVRKIIGEVFGPP